MNELKLSSNAHNILREERKKAGITQVELANRMGLRTSQQIWNIENAKNRLTLELAINAANALNISINVFLCKKVKQNI